MKKSKEILLYLGFGVATTAVNFLTFWVLEGLLGAELYLLNNVLAWVAAVIFAFVTNKLFVFQSKSWAWNCLRKEVPEFVGARILSLGVEELGLWLFVDLLGFDALVFPILTFTVTGTLLAKLVLAVIVVIMNYFFSKFIIFKKT